MTLIAQLKAAPGPSRTLDHLIGEHVGARMGWGGDLEGLGYRHYTSSIDAALSLVPEGWFPGLVKKPNGWECYVHNGETHFRGMAAMPNPKMIWITADRTPYPALGMCIAVLRVLEIIAEGDHGIQS